MKLFQLHLGHSYLIDMEGLYNYKTIHKDWQKFEDNSGEYKDDIYYTFDSHRLLELILQGYAELIDIKTIDFEVEYYFKMRRGY